MSFFNMAQDIVVFNRGMKRFLYWCLSSPMITRNFIYQRFYKRKIERDIAKYRERPRKIRIENTNICTAKCSFCPHEEMTRRQGVMDMNLFGKIVDEALSIGIENMAIYGFGEPLLDKFFFDRVKYCHEKGTRCISTNTNASFLSKEVAHNLLDSYLNEIYISFDAASKDSYKHIRPGLDFDKVEGNIRYLCEEKTRRRLQLPRIYLSFVECDYNKEEIGAYYAKWRRLVDGISFSIAHNWAGSDKERTPSVDCVLRDPCRLLWTEMFIDWEGRAQLCCMDYDSRLTYGDAKEENLLGIWHSEKITQYRKNHITKDFKAISLCSECSYNCHNKSPWWVNK